MGSVNIPNPTVVMRSYFSSQYLWSAIHHAKLAESIEAGHAGASRFSIKHRAYVLGAITDSVAFAEAAVNEVLADVADGHESYIQPLSSTTRHRFQGFWIAANNSASILAKYSETLQMAECRPPDRGAAPWQDMSLLVSLRNHVVHYKPEDVSDALEPSKLARGLIGRFSDNALMLGAGNSWFPDKALGAGCAWWAWTTAKEFVDQWSGALGLKLNYVWAVWDEV